MHDVILCQAGYDLIIESTNKRNYNVENHFFEIMNFKGIIHYLKRRDHQFSISPKYPYNSLKSIKEKKIQVVLGIAVFFRYRHLHFVWKLSKCEGLAKLCKPDMTRQWNSAIKIHPIKRKYSRTSLARTPIARFPRLHDLRTRSWVPKKKSHSCRHYCNWNNLWWFFNILILVCCM